MHAAKRIFCSVGLVCLGCASHGPAGVRTSTSKASIVSSVEVGAQRPPHALALPEVNEPEPLTWRVNCDPDGISDIAGFNGDDLWAIEGEHNLLHFNGIEWSVALKSPFPVAALFASASDDVWAVGSGSALRYDGHEWKRVETGSNVSLVAVWAAARNDVWFAGNESGKPQILHFDGVQFKPYRTTDFGPSMLNDIWGTSPSDVWAVGGQTVAHFNGSDWSIVPLPSTVFGNRSVELRTIWGSGKGDCWFAGNAPRGPSDRPYRTEVLAYHFDGNRWKESPLPYLNIDHPTVRKLRGHGAKSVWLVGDGFRMQFDGKRWQTMPINRPPLPRAAAVWVGSSNDIWLADQSLAHWDGSRLLGRPSHAPGACGDTPDLQLTDIWGNTPRDIWLSAHGPRKAPKLWHSEGTNWLPVANSAVFPRDVALEAIRGTHSGDLWLVGNFRRRGGDAILQVWSVAQKRGPLGWSKGTRLWPGSVYALAVQSTDAVYAVGRGGLALRFDGQSWNVELLGVPESEGFTLENSATVAPSLPNAQNLTREDLLAVWQVPEGDVWAAGNNGVLLHRVDAKWTLVPSGTPNQIKGLWGSSQMDVWAVGKAGTIMHFNGAVWERIDSPVKSNLSAVWGSAPNDIWAVGDLGAILHFRGHAWHSVESGTTHDLIHIWGTSSDDIWAIGAYVVLHATP